MNIRNCRSCGRIFNYVSGPAICPACRDSIETKFQEVKDYIRDNRGVGIQEVAEACEVEASQIRQWLREERLELTPDSPMVLSCEKCGEPIRSGRFCAKCKDSMTKSFNDVLSTGQPAPVKEHKQEQGQSAKMRFL